MAQKSLPKAAMLKRIHRSLVGLAIASVVLSPTVAAAQIPRLGIAGGVTQFDLSGTGSTPFGAVRIELPLAMFILEGSVGAFRPQEQLSERRTYIIPEGQLQWQIFPMIIRPYLGIGGGWVRAVSGPDPHNQDATVSGSAGIRAGLPGMPFTLRAELRVRGIGTGFKGSASEWTIGLSK
jgi:hypothetical protein